MREARADAARASTYRTCLIILWRARTAVWTATISGPAVTARAVCVSIALTRRGSNIRRSIWSRRTEFVGREFSIAIFVELSQRVGGLVDLRLIDHAVTVRIKRGEERRNRPASRSHRTICVRAALVGWSAIARGTAVSIGFTASRTLAKRTNAVARILGQSDRWQRKSQRHQKCCCLLHLVLFLL